MSVVTPAVSNALHDALGIRLHRAPFTPERVWRAVQAARSGVPSEAPALDGGPATPGIPDWWTATERDG
jgi:hypothetical protein